MAFSPLNVSFHTLRHSFMLFQLLFPFSIIFHSDNLLSGLVMQSPFMLSGIKIVAFLAIIMIQTLNQLRIGITLSFSIDDILLYKLNIFQKLLKI